MDTHIERPISRPREGRSGRRPSSEQQSGHEFWETPLYYMLEQKMQPFVERGRLSVARLSEAMDLRTQTVYTMLKTERVSPRAARSLLKIADDLRKKGMETITEEELLPYLLK